MNILLLRLDYQKTITGLLARFPDASHVDRFIDSDTTVISPDGETNAVLLRNAVPSHLHMLAFELLRTVDDVPSGRPSAMGTKSLPRSLGLDGRPSPRRGVNARVLELSEARHGKLGFDAPGHETPFTARHREMLVGNERLIKLVDGLYKKFLPIQHERQLVAANKIPHCRLANTVFTTMYATRNFRTAYHRDANNLPGVMTSLLPLGKFEGGALVLPRFRIAIDFRPGDVLFFDPNQLHGNLPFKGQRVSIALYCGGWAASL